MFLFSFFEKNVSFSVFFGKNARVLDIGDGQWKKHAHLPKKSRSQGSPNSRFSFASSTDWQTKQSRHTEPLTLQSPRRSGGRSNGWTSDRNRVSEGSEDSVGAASAEDRHSAVDGRFSGDTKSRPHFPESSDDSVGATGAVHRRTDENPSCATENKSPTMLRRRSVITQRRCRSSRRSRRLFRYSRCCS